MGQLFDRMTAGLPPNPNRAANWIAVGSGLSQLAQGGPVDLSQHHARIQERNDQQEERKGLTGAIESLKEELGPERYKALLGAPPAIQKAIITKWYEQQLKPQDPWENAKVVGNRVLRMGDAGVETIYDATPPPAPGNDYERHAARERAAGRVPVDEFEYRRQVAEAGREPGDPVPAYASMTGHEAAAAGIITPQQIPLWNASGLEERGEYVKTQLVPQQETPTTDMKNFEAAVADGSFDASKGLTGWIEWEQSKKAPAVVINPADAIQGEISKVVGERVGESWGKAEDARTLIGIMDSARPLIDDMIAGVGANARVDALRFLELLGVEMDPETMAAADSSQAYAAVMGRAVATVIKDFGAGTGLSDADREYAAKITAGTIALDKEAIKKIFEIAEKAARGKIYDHNDFMQRVGSGNVQDITTVRVPPVAAPAPPPPPQRRVYNPATGRIE